MADFTVEISLNLSKNRNSSSVQCRPSKKFEELERIDKIAFMRSCERTLEAMRKKIEKEVYKILGPAHGH
jgi:hypothetical protein